MFSPSLAGGTQSSTDAHPMATRSTIKGSLESSAVKSKLTPLASRYHTLRHDPAVNLTGGTSMSGHVGPSKHTRKTSTSAASASIAVADGGVEAGVGDAIEEGTSDAAVSSSVSIQLEALSHETDDP